MRRTRWRCFWRWPIGHQWERMTEGQYSHQRCRDCGKKKGHWSPDSGNTTQYYGGSGGE